MFWNKKYRLYITEVETGAIYDTERFPYYVGFSGGCDISLPARDVNPMASVVFVGNGSNLNLKSSGVIFKLFVDGSAVKSGEVKTIQPDTIHTLLLQDKMFYFCWSTKGVGCMSSLNVKSWSAFDSQSNEYIFRGVSFGEIKYELEKNTLSIENVVIVPDGASNGFWAKDVVKDFKPEKSVVVKETNVSEHLANVIPQKIDEDFGELICPSCWLRFNTDELNYISVHASLMGDPLLGEDEKLRFLPISYNARGMPLDPMGVPAREMACPHCHRRLPSTFLQMKNHIVSLVGAPSSGKSYYLSILLHFMPDILFKNANVALVDADPPLNAVITSMRNGLFAVDGSDEHFLAKTQLEGGMYDKLVRHGKMVSLPKPFTYVLRDMNDFSNQSSVTFYDNAGEHFEPNVSIDDSPGSLHVASADVLMFLFDPLTSNEFKMRLNSNIDPQLSKNMIDQQDIILAEMANRIKQIKNITNSYELGTPFAFMVNKCDAIGSLFDCSQLEDPLVNGKWDNEIVDRNSAKIRQFLLSIVPNVVINAEMISKNIRYFMVSSFGHSPRKIQLSGGGEFIAPEIAKIKPYQIHAPFVWAFTNLQNTPLASFTNKKQSSSSAFIF